MKEFLLKPADIWKILLFFVIMKDLYISAKGQDPQVLEAVYLPKKKKVPAPESLQS